MRLLYFAPSSFGGLADYAHAQASALGEEEIDVAFLCAPDFPAYPNVTYKRLPRLLPSRAMPGTIKPVRAWRMARATIANHLTLGQTAARGRYPFVLFSAFAEYFAPLWVDRLRRLDSVSWGAVVHDPVRDTVRGPPAWHRRSIAATYSLLQVAFVHEEIALDTAGAAPAPAITVIPHGPLSFPQTGISQAAARQKLGLPEREPVLLQFGHIRDGKNLDLVLDALPEFPQVHLVVAGREQSGGQRPAAFYRERAKSHGIADRCHWFVRRIPEPEVEVLFTAADYVLLTYSTRFRSASGVFNAAVQFRKECLATSGEGPLKSAVTRYGIGVWRPPDDRAALREGLAELLRGGRQPKWEAYLRDHSWKTNARRVIDTFQALPNHRPLAKHPAPAHPPSRH